LPNITEVNEFTANVPAVQDTITTLDAAGLNPAPQALANRTKYLKGAIDTIVATLATLKAAAFLAVGTVSGTVAAGDHGHTNTSNIGGPYAPAGTLQSAYPVGSLYFNATDGTSPATLFGFGTWTALGAGRMPLSAGTGYTAGQTGGEATHTLTIDEMPTHHHSFSQVQAMNWMDHQGGSGVEPFANANTADTGGGQAHNNMPPYIAVYIWQRVA